VGVSAVVRGRSVHRDGRRPGEVDRIAGLGGGLGWLRWRRIGNGWKRGCAGNQFAPRRIKQASSLCLKESPLLITAGFSFRR
jgi:hypothetical protein